MVTTTPLQIIVAAYNLSSKNKPGTIATEATELLQVVIRAMRSVYSLAPRFNFLYFVGYVDVAAEAESGGPGLIGWQVPQEAESTFLRQRTATTTGGTGSAGDEVVLVPFDDRKAEEGKGAVYRLGQMYFPAGNSRDPTGGDLRLYFSRRPTDPADINEPLDSQWPEQFNDVLIFDVGAYLATKDGRDGEAAALRAERGLALQRFAAHLDHCEATEIRRVANVRRFNSNALVPLTTFGLPGAAG